jgi:biotin-dependent carboxylase-like uncharacterized protein
MSQPVLKILDPGMGASLQDGGRRGWRRFGVPPSGAMDEHAAQWANRLLDNAADAPVVELVLLGALLQVAEDTWLALTGANVATSLPMWRAVRIKAGDYIQLLDCQAGVWSYIAVEGGIAGEKILGSASAYPRGGLGRSLKAGDVLEKVNSTSLQLPPHVAGRSAAWDERRDYASPPALRVWRGPQWDLFSEADQQRFFQDEWTVSSQSDRVGYRLIGRPLKLAQTQIISEPVLVGSIQVPENGQPIVTMRDGPTVGGYPKLGVLDPVDVSWLAQCRSNQKIRFRLVA